MDGGATEHTRTFETVWLQRKLERPDASRKKVSGHIDGRELLLLVSKSLLHGHTAID